MAIIPASAVLSNSSDTHSGVRSSIGDHLGDRTYHSFIFELSTGDHTGQLVISKTFRLTLIMITAISKVPTGLPLIIHLKIP